VSVREGRGTEYRIANINRRHEALCEEGIRAGKRPMSISGWLLRSGLRIGMLIVVVIAGYLLLRLW
jgi:hypothetical protein